MIRQRRTLQERQKLLAGLALATRSQTKAEVVIKLLTLADWLDEHPKIAHAWAVKDFGGSNKALATWLRGALEEIKHA